MKKVTSLLKGLFILIITPAEISKGQRRRNIQRARKLMAIF